MTPEDWHVQPVPCWYQIWAVSGCSLGTGSDGVIVKSTPSNIRWLSLFSTLLNAVTATSLVPLLRDEASIAAALNPAASSESRIVSLEVTVPYARVSTPV